MSEIDDPSNAEISALVREKLRTGAYLAELEKLYYSSTELYNIPKKWSEWCSKKLTANDETSKKLQTVRARRNAWYHKMNGMAHPEYLSSDLQRLGRLALSNPEERKNLSDEFVVVAELYCAGISEFASIKDEINCAERKFAEEANVLEVAICVNRNKTKIEFLENELKQIELKIMKKK